MLQCDSGDIVTGMILAFDFQFGVIVCYRGQISQDALFRRCAVEGFGGLRRVEQ